MSLTRVVLASGRSVDLPHLRLSSTYGGLLEGHPHRALNDRRVGRLCAAAVAQYPRTPTHLVPPPREHPDDDRVGRTRLFGPVELLPPVACIGLTGCGASPGTPHSAFRCCTSARARTFPWAPARRSSRRDWHSARPSPPA